MVRALAFLTFLLLCAAPAAHANIFLELVGETQGVIDGDSTFPGEENRIEISSFAHGGYVLYQGGVGVVGRGWAEINLSKQWDPSSVNLVRAQAENELLTTCNLLFYDDFAFATEGEGLARRMPHLYLKVELVRASITSYNVGGAESTNAAESLSLSCEEIRYTYLDTGQTFSETIYGPGTPKEVALESLGGPARDAASRGAFDFAVPEDDEIDVEIVDEAGRPVKTLHARDSVASGGALRWDGTDAQGRKVTPGVYTATVRSTAGETIRRMVVGE